MYKRSKSSWLKHLDFILIDLICMELAFVIAYVIRHGIASPYQTPLYRDMAAIFALIDMVIVFFNESYKSILKRGHYREFILTFQHTSLVIIVSGIYLFLTQKAEGYSRITFILMWVINIALSFGCRIFRKYFLKKRLKVNGGKKRSLLIITEKDKAQSVVQNILENNFEELAITGICIVDEELEGTFIKGVKIVANVDDILEYICRSWIDEVFMNVSKDFKLSEKISNSCIEMGVTVHLKLAKVINMKGEKQAIEKLAGYTVLSSSINMATQKQLISKRVLDIFGGIIGLIIAGILFIFVAPIIYSKSPGPIFFSQWRVGKNGKKFKIYKFRSMYMDAEKRKKELMEQNKIKDGFMFKMDKDPRIIGGENGKGIGNFIRNTSIDEFPQFWNVLKGEMSLVGTRPPTVDEWERYELHHRKRLAIKPGLTGMWQISGRSEIVDFEEVVKLDAEYITGWNFGLDFKILFRTVIVVLGRKGSS